MAIKIATSIYHPSSNAKGVFLFIHGMSEHRKRYDDFARFLCKSGFGVLTYDQVGHGESVESEDDLGFFGEHDGYEGLVFYAYKLLLEAKKEFKDVPLFVFGHSMGSILTRSLLKRYPNMINGVILSGPTYYQSLAKAGLFLSNVLSRVSGSKSRSDILHSLTFDNFSKQIDDKTENAWLSVNEDNVKRYNEDKLCGFNFTNKGYYDMFSGLIDIHDVNNYINPDSNKPILIVAGKDDPVIGKEKGMKITVNDLLKAGYSNVEVKLYENARHEVLFDNVSKEVYKDILDWTIKNV